MSSECLGDATVGWGDITMREYDAIKIVRRGPGALHSYWDVVWADPGTLKSDGGVPARLSPAGIDWLNGLRRDLADCDVDGPTAAEYRRIANEVLTMLGTLTVVRVSRYYSGGPGPVVA